MPKFGGAAGAGTVATSRSASAVEMKLSPHNVYRFECIGADGQVKWVDEVTNLVTTVGANDLLSKYFQGSAYTAAWFIGLISGATPTLAIGDTAASHAAWTEYALYSQGTRPAWAGGAAATKSIDNSASQALFTINGGGGTVGGAFLISNSTKSGTTGILYGEAALTTARTLADGDTLNITVTLTV